MLNTSICSMSNNSNGHAKFCPRDFEDYVNEAKLAQKQATEHLQRVVFFKEIKEISHETLKTVALFGDDMKNTLRDPEKSERFFESLEGQLETLQSVLKKRKIESSSSSVNS